MLSAAPGKQKFRTKDYGNFESMGPQATLNIHRRKDNYRGTSRKLRVCLNVFPHDGVDSKPYRARVLCHPTLRHKHEPFHNF